MAKINEALRIEIYPFAFLSGWVSLVAQMVKNLSAMQKTWIQSLGQEDPLQKGMTASPVFLPGKFHGQRNLVGYTPWGHRVGQIE